MATRAAQLYEDDFYAWTKDQASALRRYAESRPNLDLDWPHLIEEVADLGTSQRDAARSQVRRIIEHCLKLEYSVARDPRPSWRDSIIDARAEADDKLSPSLHDDLEQHLPRIWAKARAKADNGLRGQSETAAADQLPADCPYRLDDLLRDDWYPRNRRGVTGDG